ncbi:MAG: FAD-dependent oxidoreductase [Clostridia bacterium]|nr:FAD-dependent oxidoreductase [Clostridia bacterium]
MLDKQTLQCDLCVVGGGMAGLCAAISAAREGIKVVLMHERPVLGGNASSEIRMWVCGAKGENNRETGILEEIALENLYRNPTKSFAIWDTVLYDFARREQNLTLLLNCTCMDAKVEEMPLPHQRDRRIKSITGYQMTTQRFYEVESRFYCDASGDSILAPLTGAEFRIGREDGKEFGEDTAAPHADSMTMGMSCLLQGRETANKITYTAPRFSTKLSDEDVANRRPNMKNDAENFWYLELGGDRDTIGDTEVLRDELVPLATGFWDYIKNSGKFDTDNWDLDFLGFLPGKRESRRMCGEYMITQRDISDDVTFDDEIAFGGWPLDDHFPGGFFHKGRPNNNVSTPQNYSIPYRALYSKNVENLFFAGRNISMTHMAMSSIRVMATCALLGEAVGKAAAVGAKRDLTPHGVYLEAIDEVQRLLLNEDCFLPRKPRRVSALCKNAALSGGEEKLRNGEDRGHAIYGTDEQTARFDAPLGKEITYSFDAAKISEVHLVFCSDLNRKTLPGSSIERRLMTRCNQKLTSPQMHMPTTLCRKFKLYGELNGERHTLLSVCDNRQRAHHIEPDMTFDKLILVPEASWGEGDTVPVISFDFA